MHRVKVYRLNDDGKWDDQGTGHVTVDFMERSEELCLLVIDEEDNETILLHCISPDVIYRKLEDTIIYWRDPEYSSELALSFQESTGCLCISDHICNVQRNLNFNSLYKGGQEPIPFEESDDSYSVNQGNWRTSNGRKDEEEEVEIRLKKPRLVWSIEVHQQFVSAVSELGIDKAVPEKILELMDVPGLKREIVASRLQKYLLYLRRLSGESPHQGDSSVGSN